MSQDLSSAAVVTEALRVDSLKVLDSLCYCQQDIVGENEIFVHTSWFYASSKCNSEPPAANKTDWVANQRNIPMQ